MICYYEDRPGEWCRGILHSIKGSKSICFMRFVTKNDAVLNFEICNAEVSFRPDYATIAGYVLIAETDTYTLRAVKVVWDKKDIPKGDLIGG